MTTRSTPIRNFLPAELSISSWEVLETWLNDLRDRELDSLDNLEKWLLDLSEMEAFIEEDAAWRYIQMTINTKDEKLTESYQWFVAEIQPKISPYSNAFNLKLAESPFAKSLSGRAYQIYLRQIQKDIELFREENILLQSEIAQLSQEYGARVGAMEVSIDGETMTMPKAASELQKTDRARRKLVWDAIQDVRNEATSELDTLFTKLRDKRHQVASNSAFKNFRDYKFEAMGRFDYSKDDCFNFHDSIAQQIKPIVSGFLKARCKDMGLERLRPWDLAVDPKQNSPLKPFETADELLEKSVEVFTKVDPYFGKCLSTMNEMGYLDLASKDGKAPGGYNYPLYESGVPFIFMNAVGTQRDMVTMMHEGGHAVHSFLTKDLPITSFKSCPSEVAELASMSMELLSMDHWDVFYPDADDLKRAKKDHLQDILSVLPWIAIVDKFQHWIYANPKHTSEERKREWLAIYEEFTTELVDYSGLEDAKAYMWQKQLHIYEVPFYYIEYGMAQLGAIAIWRNFKSNPEQAVSDYIKALKLGYTASIPEIYAAAGISFDFSSENVGELAKFVNAQLEQLQD